MERKLFSRSAPPQSSHNQRSSPLQFLENCHSSGRLESPSDNCQTSQAGSIPSFRMCQWILRPILCVFIILSVKIWQTDNLVSLGLINCQVDLTWCSIPFFGVCQWILHIRLCVFIILSLKIWQTDNLVSVGLWLMVRLTWPDAELVCEGGDVSHLWSWPRENMLWQRSSSEHGGIGYFLPWKK